MLWRYNSRCANEDCRCLLADPEEVDAQAVRTMLSFGTVEARVGSKSIRSLVSSNRKFAYPCLYTIAAYWEYVCKPDVPLEQADIFHRPSAELVTLIFWYSRIFHNVTCKAQRGKPSITSFA